VYDVPVDVCAEVLVVLHAEAVHGDLSCQLRILVAAREHERCAFDVRRGAFELLTELVQPDQAGREHLRRQEIRHPAVAETCGAWYGWILTARDPDRRMWFLHRARADAYPAPMCSPTPT
jgi:hypothetical protein